MYYLNLLSFPTKGDFYAPATKTASLCPSPAPPPSLVPPPTLVPPPPTTTIRMSPILMSPTPTILMEIIEAHTSSSGIIAACTLIFLLHLLLIFLLLIFLLLIFLLLISARLKP